MKTLVQLYSARNFTPWDRILDQVKSSAYDGVEGFFANYEDPAAFRRLLDERGLIMPQGHFGLDLLESNFEKAISIARTLGIDTVIAPWLAPEDRPADLAGWKILAARLTYSTTKFEAKDLTSRGTITILSLYRSKMDLFQWTFCSTLRLR